MNKGFGRENGRNYADHKIDVKLAFGYLKANLGFTPQIEKYSLTKLLIKRSSMQYAFAWNFFLFYLRLVMS